MAKRPQVTRKYELSNNLRANAFSVVAAKAWNVADIRLDKAAVITTRTWMAVGEEPVPEPKAKRILPHGTCQGCGIPTSRTYVNFCRRCSGALRSTR